MRFINSEKSDYMPKIIQILSVLAGTKIMFYRPLLSPAILIIRCVLPRTLGS